MTSTTSSAPTTSTPASNPLASRRAAGAVTTMFAVNGLLMGGNGGALPSLREKLAIDDTSIAVMLFCAGLAGIISMQVGGRLADAVGARKVTLTALPLLVAAAVIIALAPTFTVALIGMIVLGLAMYTYAGWTYRKATRVGP